MYLLSRREVAFSNNIRQNQHVDPLGFQPLKAKLSAT